MQKVVLLNMTLHTIRVMFFLPKFKVYYKLCRC